MTRRLVFVVLIAVVLVAGGFTAAWGQQRIRLIVNGAEVYPDVPPQIIGGRTMVPLRAVAEVLGADIQWDGITQTVTATKGRTVVRLVIGQKTAYIDGQPRPLDVPAKVVDGRTLVPLRFVSESLGAQVEYYESTQTVAIRSIAPTQVFSATPPQPTQDTRPQVGEAAKAQLLARVDALISLVSEKKRAAHEYIDNLVQDKLHVVRVYFDNAKQQEINHYSRELEKGRQQYEAGQIGWDAYQLTTKVLQDEMTLRLAELDQLHSKYVAVFDDLKKHLYQQTDEYYDKLIDTLVAIKAQIARETIVNPTEIEMAFDKIEEAIKLIDFDRQFEEVKKTLDMYLPK